MTAMTTAMTTVSGLRMQRSDRGAIVGVIALLVGCTMSMCALAIRRSDQLLNAERATDVADLVALGGARFGPAEAAELARANGAGIVSWSETNEGTVRVEVSLDGTRATAHAEMVDRDSDR